MTNNQGIIVGLAVAVAAAIGLYQNEGGPALPLSEPFGTYEDRASAMAAATAQLDRGRCVTLSPVNEEETELQPC